MITSKKLSKQKKISHGFFNKSGGKSTGIYKSLNCGVGSKDKRSKVKKNLKIVKDKICKKANNIFLVNQIHSNKFIFLNKNFKFSKKKIKVISFNNLTIELCKKYKASAIIRGLRAVSDFEYEFQLAGMNKKLNPKIETMFLMSDVENQIISSKFVKEIIKLKGDIKKFTTKNTIKLLKKKI